MPRYTAVLDACVLAPIAEARTALNIWGGSLMLEWAQVRVEVLVPVRVRRGVTMIARTWRGWVRTEQAAAYVEYITRTGLSAYEKTPGNLGAQMWTTDLGDGRTEVMTVSWWSSRTDIKGFAGQDIDVAVFYPEDDDYLIDRETTVTHYDVARTP